MGEVSLTEQFAREARSGIRKAIREAYPCRGGHHSKAGHSDMACFSCGGTLISKQGLDHIRDIEGRLDAVLATTGREAEEEHDGR